MDDSVLERASIRLASFEGDEGGAEVGTIESNIVERSLAGFVGFPGEGERGASGEEFLLPGEPYVTVTFGFGDEEHPRSAPTSSSVWSGDGVRTKSSTDTLRRLRTAECISP